MPDFAMCNGIKDEDTKCKQRKNCVRCISKPDMQNQTFIQPPFVVLKDGSTDCLYFWDVSTFRRKSEDDKAKS